MATLHIQDCRLRTDSPIYYATREVGRLYETGDHLHNFALTYALGLVSEPPSYHVYWSEPTYERDFAPLTEQGVYVTPASPRRVNHMISSLKFGGETWQETVFDKRETGNRPNYGRIKEIAPDSWFAFRVISPEPLRLPRWIRLGIWLGKCEVMVRGIGTLSVKHEIHTFEDALNPLDLKTMPDSYDIVPMPPNSLIKNATLTGDWLTGTLYLTSNQATETIHLPAHMAYFQKVSANG
ncbi:MAG: hypothetical protein BroJett018_32710 [Chloroflexota bacterium]|nr:type I-D CRISPR-associated protein Cas5/Csc1 [Chloroflexota bacterium]NOG62330.1 type I-D CRISPR-associated protein Cas5/Csc1 [Chloroflexota bacterium]GIK65477.1 MAG: hypothetical protein BroJett018_32710 [Chloroflexota bacterium]